jgi:hypothetical protein
LTSFFMAENTSFQQPQKWEEEEEE